MKFVVAVALLLVGAGSACAQSAVDYLKDHPDVKKQFLEKRKAAIEKRKGELEAEITTQTDLMKSLEKVPVRKSAKTEAVEKNGKIIVFASNEVKEEAHLTSAVKM